VINERVQIIDIKDLIDSDVGTRLTRRKKKEEEYAITHRGVLSEA
jgi:hypothetical protein